MAELRRKTCVRVLIYFVKTSISNISVTGTDLPLNILSVMIALIIIIIIIGTIIRARTKFSSKNP